VIVTAPPALVAPPAVPAVIATAPPVVLAVDDAPAFSVRALPAPLCNVTDALVDEMVSEPVLAPVCEMVLASLVIVRSSLMPRVVTLLTAPLLNVTASATTFPLVDEIVSDVVGLAVAVCVMVAVGLARSRLVD
jgi:hypothetical protein